MSPTEQTETALAEARTLADSARQGIADAKQAVTEAETALESATAAAKAKPSSKTVTDRSVAELVLENARETHQAAIREAQPLITAEIQARNAHAVAVALVDASTYSTDIAADVACIVEAEASIREAVARLQARNEKHRKNIGVCGPGPNIHRFLDDRELATMVRAGIFKRYDVAHMRPNEFESVHPWIAVTQ